MKLLFIAALLVVWFPPLSSTPCNVVLRAKRDAVHSVCQTQRHSLQDALKSLTFPLSFGSGLLGSVIKFSGLDILDVKLPELDVSLTPGIGMHVSIDTYIWASGNALLIGPVSIEVGASIQVDLKMARTKSGLPVLSISACKSALGQIKVTGGLRLVSSVINTVTQQIGTILGKTLCVTIAPVLSTFNANLGLMVGFSPISEDVGIEYTMPANPVVTKDYMDMDFNAQYEVDKKTVEISNGERNFIFPADAGSIHSMVNMGFSPDFFSSYFLASHRAGAFDLKIPSTSPSLGKYLTTAALARYIPQVSQKYQGSLPVDINIRSSEEPIVTLQPSQLLVRTPLLADLSVVRTTPEHLVTIHLDITFIANMNANEGKLKIELRVGTFISTISSTSIGNFDVATMDKYLGIMCELACLPQINGHLGVGISLPSLPNIYTTNEVVVVTEDYAVMSCDLKYVEQCGDSTCKNDQ